ncbi:MAG: DUF2062 domain-containing protein [Desulforegulaceae bacterium]|nr:DUF2062 domain-containing protein [Desulforegulaceae bacterium]
MKRFQKFLWKLATLDGSAENIARGVAAGTFISFSPLVPFHTILGITLAFFVKGSKRAAMIAVWLSNPITIPLFYAASYYTGISLLGFEHADIGILYELIDIIGSKIKLGIKIEQIQILLESEMYIFYSMLFGGVVLGLPSAIASYFISKYWVKRLRNEEDITIE